MKRALVTGGAGFLGSHLVGSLLKKGNKVICVDNLITGRRANVAQYKKGSDFEFVKADVVNDELDIKKLDFVFHLASPASPADFKNLALEIALTNSTGTLKMLQLAKKHKAKFLLASTSETYGDPEVHPQTEDYFGNVNSFGPRSCYDEAKRFAETLTYIYLKRRKVDARVIRIFNTYGPNMRVDDGRMIPNFITQAIKEKPLTVYGDGKQTRSLCFVSDLIEGMQKAMFTRGTKGEIFNLGNPDEYSVLEMAKIIKKSTNSKSEITFTDFPKDDPKRRKPDITKAKKVLDWKPKVPLKKGLEKTIDYFKKEIK